MHGKKRKRALCLPPSRPAEPSSSPDAGIERMRPAMPPALANFADASDNGEEPGRQRKRGAELEQAIRDATITELAKVGYGSVTIESVAARAQTGKASIYLRWPTKQELVVDSVGCL